MADFFNLDEHSLPTGWIPYSERSPRQKLFSDVFGAVKPRFRDISGPDVKLPERVILADLEREATGGDLLPRIWQTTGSCVGAGGARAYSHSICGDIVIRGDLEAAKIPFPYATYGVGRQIAGMSRPGSGSFGSAQSEACQPDEFGMLPWDDPRVPPPKIIADGTHASWAKWTEREELAWSHPSGWPVPRDELEADSKAWGLHDVAKILELDELLQALVKGFGVTVASMFGTKPKVEGNVLLGRWNDSWAHQMSYGGFWNHPTHGMLILQDNQWGPTIHGDCPTLEPMGIRGSYWQLAKDAEKIMGSRDGEVFAHTTTGGFPTAAFDWGSMGWSYE